MRIIPATLISESVERLFIKANRQLPLDVQNRIRECRANEAWDSAKDLLDTLILNFETANRAHIPICQDTGMACVFLEIGDLVHIDGNPNAAIDEGVRNACKKGFLRASMVGDPLERVNSGDNTPAMKYFEFVNGDQIKIIVAPKGFGSENMSRIAMLNPADGADGVFDFVLDTVKKAGSNPCPPIVVGIGIGGSFDKAALLAKKALLRPLETPHPLPFYAALEKKLLDNINKLGIGAAGMGGAITALAAAIEIMPTHIAGLPLAVNINCHVSRHAEEIL